MILVYYTALILGYSLNGEKLSATFWMNSYQQCLEAMDHLEDMYDFIADHVTTDDRMFMWCHKSDVPSNEIIKPRMRPNT
tara:strand:+ start:344 stop:583 length:240 start_codon:yes stop_codon:yes gene_type:complete